jgi:V/A-type H+-transporting ATPase subunit I
MLRARVTRWFEIITTREDFARVMQALAHTGAAQLEARPLEEDTRPVLPRLEAFHEEFAAIEKTYGLYWPEVEGTVLSELKNPVQALDQALGILKRWAVRAQPVIAQVQALETEAAELALVGRLIAATGAGFPFARMPASAASKLARAVYFLPGEDRYDPSGDDVLAAEVATPEGLFVIALADQAQMTGFEAAMSARKGVRVVIPPFLGDDPASHASRIAAAEAENMRAQIAACNRLNHMAVRYRLAEVLSQIAVLKWLYDNIGDVQATERTIRITGWTKSQTGARLRRALDAAGANYVLSVAARDADGNTPVFLFNPRWLAAFEFFPRLLGMPGRGEADPSAVTALMAPVMFGFMFGDVGQGAVLVAIGVYLRKRLPLLALLIPGGIAAMFFGVLFGSVFSREDIIPALWLHPLNEPVTVLAVALAMGVVFLLVGIALDILQAAWQGVLAGWLMKHGGIVLAYLGLIAAWWLPAALWALPLGIALALLGARGGEGRATGMAVAAALGEYVESLMRLFVSSVSFARVGAFALAHAGLSAAIIGIAEAAGGVGYLVIWFIGNVLIIALEGLVTGIQTTRLILFEFFTRFYHAGGREFRPLSVPDFHSRKHEGNRT